MAPQQEHRCKQARVLALCGTLLMIALGWLFLTVQAGEVDRATVKTQMGHMADDIRAIRAVLEEAAKRGSKP